MKSSMIISAVIGVAIVGGIVMLAQRNSAPTTVVPAGSNVTMENGKQIIQVDVKGGYQPAVSAAKAGIPTILRFQTKGTYDCSSSVRIPSMNVSKTLPASGVTDIDLGVAQAGALQGTCGMGMYHFKVDFQS
jgi:plastocyanin domain-containing protein